MRRDSPIKNVYFDEVRVAFADHLETKGFLRGLTRSYLHNRFHLRLPPAGFNTLKPFFPDLRGECLRMVMGKVDADHISITPGISTTFSQMEEEEKGEIAISSTLAGSDRNDNLYELDIGNAGQPTRRIRLIFAPRLIPEMFLDIDPKRTPPFLSVRLGRDKWEVEKEEGMETMDLEWNEEEDGACVIPLSHPLFRRDFHAITLFRRKKHQVCFAPDNGVILGRQGHIVIDGEGGDDHHLILFFDAETKGLFTLPLNEGNPVLFKGKAISHPLKLLPKTRITLASDLWIESVKL